VPSLQRPGYACEPGPAPASLAHRQHSINAAAGRLPHHVPLFTPRCLRPSAARLPLHSTIPPRPPSAARPHFPRHLLAATLPSPLRTPRLRHPPHAVRPAIAQRPPAPRRLPLRRCTRPEPRPCMSGAHLYAPAASLRSRSTLSSRALDCAAHRRSSVTGARSP
jgi:hypothetical protein